MLQARRFFFENEELIQSTFDCLDRYKANGSGALNILSCINLVEGLLLTYESDTQKYIKKKVLDNVCNRYEILLDLFNSSCASLMLSSALIMKSIVEETDVSISKKMQDSALSQGILLKHFYNSLFSPIEDQRYVSRYLVSIWMQFHQPSMELLSKMVPEGMRNYLVQKPLTQSEIDEYMAQEKLEFLNNDDTTPNSAQSWMRNKIQKIVKAHPNPKEQNFTLFFFKLLKEHSSPDNIWNKTTLTELRTALETELALFDQENRDQKSIWNYYEFFVDYPSLSIKLILK